MDPAKRGPLRASVYKRLQLGSATRIAHYRNLSVANRFCWDDEPEIVSDAASRAVGKTPLDSCDSLLANPAAIDNKQAWEFDL